MLGPPDHTPVLPYYDGVFSHGFVALHPFFTIEGVHPEQCEYGTLALERSEAPDDINFLEWFEREEAARHLGKYLGPGEVDLAAKCFGKPMGWREVGRQIGMQDHCALDRALRTSIGGLQNKSADLPAAERLGEFCLRQGLFPPTEGRIQPIMHRSLIELFRRSGFESLIAGDEFGDDERLVDLALLEEDGLWDRRTETPVYGIKRLIAPDRSMLAYTHWDSFYLLILGTAASLGSIDMRQLFEGFWCTDRTTTYWLNEPPVPLVG